MHRDTELRCVPACDSYNTFCHVDAAQTFLVAVLLGAERLVLWSLGSGFKVS